MNNVQWLEVGAESLGLWDILIGWMHLVWAKLLDGSICSSGKDVNSDDLHCLGTDDGRDGEGHGVVVSVWLVGVLWIFHIDEALEHALIIVDTIRAWVC